MDERHFQRNRYTESQRLTAADLENQQAYDSGKRQLLTRAFFGHGVVYGLKVRHESASFGFFVEAGLALDAAGREIIVPEEAFFLTAEIFPREAHPSQNWHICIRYDEWECGEGHVLQPNGMHIGVANRVNEGYRILAVESPDAQEICLARIVFSMGKNAIPSVSAILAPLKSNKLRFGQAHTAIGTIRIADRGGGCGEDTLYSEEISHGLGAGDVQITLSVEVETRGRRSVISGAAELFNTKLRLAAKLFPDSGTFVAAVQLHGGIQDERTLIVHWTAQKIENSADCGTTITKEITAPERRLLHLEPRISLLWPGEQVQFLLCGENGRDRNLELRFFLLNGDGEISESGLFTAPQVGGTYRIRAICKDEPQKIFNASVMVFERGEEWEREGIFR